MVYHTTHQIPAEQRFGLTSQLRRACSSADANLAEDCGRGTDADFSHHVQIAMGSTCEAECHLLLAKELSFIPASDDASLQQEVERVKRMLASLRKALNGKGRQVLPNADSGKPIAPR
jgi:four helix bundle protein